MKEIDQKASQTYLQIDEAKLCKKLRKSEVDPKYDKIALRTGTKQFCMELYLINHE